MEKKTTYIGFVVTAEQKQALADVVAETHIAQAELLRMGLTMVLEKYQQAPGNSSVERGGYRNRKSAHTENSADQASQVVETEQTSATLPATQASSAPNTASKVRQPGVADRAQSHGYSKDQSLGKHTKASRANHRAGDTD